MFLAIQIFALFIGFFAFVQGFGDDRLAYRVAGYAITAFFVGVTIVVEVFYKG